ncbi:MAG TPA: zinc dependent phospholipase C family protein [Phototrophicaceae bacterium]|nr:zinc dependent phospholipase C family protein [Phototrophicaceae bacterium]
MPTPFTHLAVAQRLLVDEQLPPEIRARLAAEQGAFLFGNIAPDARPPGREREDTHFYVSSQVLQKPCWQMMMDKCSALLQPTSAGQAAFLAGYIAHLAMDEIWTRHMLEPHFLHGDWATRAYRFQMLHVLLIEMDQRDYGVLEAWQYGALAGAQPEQWLPFIDDTTLAHWRDFVAEQLKPGGVIQTLTVFGKRLSKSPDDLRRLLESPQDMYLLRENVTPEIQAALEVRMYDHAREQISQYLAANAG